MTPNDYRSSLSWRQAIALAPGLVRLAEELPASEQMGLSQQMRSLMVELPAAIALDLLQDAGARYLAILRLQAILELIDRVYPALDTGQSHTATDALADRLMGPDFAEQQAPAIQANSANPTVHTALSAGDEPAAELPTAQPESDQPVLDQQPAPPFTVQVQQAPTEQPNPLVHPSDVQPNSGQ